MLTSCPPRLINPVPDPTPFVLITRIFFASRERFCGTGVSPVGTRAGRPCPNVVAAEGRAVLLIDIRALGFFNRHLRLVAGH